MKNSVPRNLHVSNHPWVASNLPILFEPRCSLIEFRTAALSIMYALAVEATANLPRKFNPPLLIAVLRGGWDLSKPLQEFFPGSPLGLVGLDMTRNTRKKETYLTEYLIKLPEETDRPVFIVDDTIASGATACRAVEIAKLNYHAEEDIRFTSLVASFSGAKKLCAEYPKISVHVGKIISDDEMYDLAQDHYKFSDRLCEVIPSWRLELPCRL